MSTFRVGPGRADALYVILQHKAYKKYGAALKRGELVRPSKCSRCGKTCKPDGHHEDYEKPLEVVWLCHWCHFRRHREVYEESILGKAA